MIGKKHERTVYEEYRSQIRALEERLTRLEERVTETAESPRYKALVKKLRAFKGIDYIIALSVVCEDRTDKNVNSPTLRLYTAAHEGDTLAAIVVLFRGLYATYLYGASSNVKRNLMAAYALQWRAMRDAKEAGCKRYDLFGIPPDDNPRHPMAGLYRFKTGFGGQVIHRPGTWDYAYKPVLYALFRKAESLRKKTRDRKKIDR